MIFQAPENFHVGVSFDRITAYLNFVNKYVYIFIPLNRHNLCDIFRIPLFTVHESRAALEKQRTHMSVE